MYILYVCIYVCTRVWKFYRWLMIEYVHKSNIFLFQNCSKQQKKGEGVSYVLEIDNAVWHIVCVTYDSGILEPQ